MRRSQPPPSPAPSAPPCPPPPSPPSGSSSPQAAGHQFSQEGRIFPKRATTSRPHIEGGEKAAPGTACPAPCSLVGCRSQARRQSGSRRSCRCQPSPARSTSAKCRGRNDWRNVEILGRKSRTIYGLLWGFLILLEEAAKASIYLWVRQGYFRTEGARHLLRAPCMFELGDREMTNIRRRTKYTLSMGGASKRSAGRWPDLMNWISTCGNDQAQF